MKNNNRPDLSANQIAILAIVVIVAINLTLLWPQLPPPGSVSGQLCATLGALLLLAPLCFSIFKRSGLSNSPPTWFVTHVLSSVVGSCLIFIHVATGDWTTPPGIVLLLLVFLLFQGSLLRAFISDGFSLLFARNSTALGFNAPATLDKTALQAVIDAKVSLLQSLDPGADEALFSPALKHWLRRPWKSCRYQYLAAQEAKMIGARASAESGLGWARRIHMLAALGFYLGLLLHILVVLFFAGYAAGDGTIDWWYITDWGR